MCFKVFNTGGLEHFYIDIHRNNEIIGGKPYEQIKLVELYNQNQRDKQIVKGFNEKARMEFLDDFFFKK